MNYENIKKYYFIVCRLTISTDEISSLQQVFSSRREANIWMSRLSPADNCPEYYFYVEDYFYY